MFRISARSARAISEGYSDIGQHHYWTRIRDAARRGLTDITIHAEFETGSHESMKEYRFLRDYVFPEMLDQGFELTHKRKLMICSEDEVELVIVDTTIDWSVQK